MIVPAAAAQAPPNVSGAVFGGSPQLLGLLGWRLNDDAVMAPRLARGLLRWLSWIRRCRPDVLQTVRRGLPDLLALLRGAFPAVEWAVVLHKKIEG